MRIDLIYRIHSKRIWRVCEQHSLLRALRRLVFPISWIINPPPTLHMKDTDFTTNTITTLTFIWSWVYGTINTGVKADGSYAVVTDMPVQRSLTLSAVHKTTRDCFRSVYTQLFNIPIHWSEFGVEYNKCKLITSRSGVRFINNRAMHHNNSRGSIQKCGCCATTLSPRTVFVDNKCNSTWIPTHLNL